MAVYHRRIAILLAALLLALGGLALSATQAQAVPAAPIDIPLHQPDGSVVIARAWGDEWQHGYETAAGGYTLLKDPASGYWVYAARQADGSLAPALGAGGERVLVAGRDQPGSLAQHLRPESDARQRQQRSAALLRASPGEAPSFSPNLGAQKVLLLLVEFSDREHTYDASIFRDRLFGAGDSVKSYYQQASFGKLNLAPAAETAGDANDGVIGWIDIGTPAPKGTAENHEGADLAPKIVNDALIKADKYIDYASFDTNRDGFISNTELHIVVVVSVYEYSFGWYYIPPQHMWAHHSALDDLGPSEYQARLDNVYLGLAEKDGGYAMFGEIHQNDTIPAHPATIGVIAHELGHDLSWPDLYDVSNRSYGVGDWSIMGGGSWNGSPLAPGDVPALPDAWSKYYQGWLAPQALSSGASYDLPAAASSPTAYLMGVNPFGVDWVFGKKQGAGEYFLIENRQPVGFDAGLPGCGVLIWHINEAATYTNWANAPSSSGAPPLVALEQADGQNDLNNFYYGNAGDPGDPFPGWSGNPIFGDQTTPSSRRYNGQPTWDKLTINSTACDATMNVSYENPSKKHRLFAPVVAR